MEPIGKLKSAAEVVASSAADYSNLGRKLRLFVVDKKTGLRFLVDSGADVSIVPLANFKNETSKSDFSLYAANGTVIPTFGIRTLNLNFGLRRDFSWPFIIAQVDRGILGADFLSHFNLVIDLKHKQLIDGVTGTRLSSNVLEINENEVISSVLKNQKFSDLLLKYTALTKPNIIPHSIKHNIKHHIHTIGQPVYSKPRQLDAAKSKLAREEFQFMLNHGIIRPSKSQWASPLHMAIKKGGTLRPCGDFRRLNDQTIPDRYPLPRIEDFHEILHGKKIYSKIDLFKAYFQIPVAEEDKAKTAIITPFGLFEFNVMPFGLRNAPSTFQRFINEVFSGLDFVFVYIDDCLIASTTEEEHRKHLQLVFERLNKYGLTINVSKSTFGVTKLEFLGYEITPDGSKPLPEKVKIIAEYKLPETIQQLRTFLGMINFFRRYLKNASQNQAILHEYLKGAKKKDKRKINWTQEAVAKFELCKQDLANAALLTYPGPNFPLALVIDASDYAVGGVVQQFEDKGWRPLAFFSKKLNDAQRAYSTYDRELLAVYLSIKHFKHLVEGRQFAVYTDHRPLTFAFKQKNEKASPRQQRQLLYISEFTTDIRHISGKTNIVADALSRIEEINTIDFDAVADAQTSDEEFNHFKNTDTSLKFQCYTLPSGKQLWCDTSTENIRPYIPQKFRKTFHNQIHNLSHSGIKSTTKQMTSRFVWPSIKKDVNEWTKTCISCQKNKINRHVKSPVGTFPTPDERFAEVHIDLVGPLPPSAGNTYLLTCIDRFTNWMEVIPIENILASTVASAFYSNWVSRFGVPKRIITDRGRQFESTLFKHFTTLCGVTMCHTSPYHPQCNGKIERLHRTLKTALRAHNSVKWTESLPTVLLGLRTVVNPDTNVSVAQMVYGKHIKMPGEFLGEQMQPEITQQIRDQGTFVKDLQECMKLLRPTPVKHKSAQSVFVHKDLNNCSHVFLRIDRVKKALEPPFEGPYPVLARNDKYFTVNINNKSSNISVDRLKPAYLLASEENDQIPAGKCTDPEVPNATSTRNIVDNQSSSTQREHPTAVTRSGRRVHYPKRFL